ncbi:MAG TPA: LysR family transcriptional regulator [Streptosporangiaceae bacterium]|jgi:DNA-binding transcriptional LysR family regulator
MEITFRELEIFLAFSRTEHLGRAAEEIGVSVPTLQRAVRSLEQRMGVPLVEREGRRIRLLHAGHVLADEAARILRARVDAREAVLAASGRSRTLLRIGHTFSLGIAFVPGVVAAFTRTAPDARVELHAGPATKMISSLLAGEIDAAFTSISPVEPDVHVITLFTETLMLAVARGDPIAARPYVDLAELRDRDFVAMPGGASSRGDLMRACARAGFVPRRLVEADDLFAIEGLVGAGLGVSLLPESMGGHDHPGVARVPLHEPVPTRRTICLAHRRDTARDPAVRALTAAALERGARHGVA